MSEKTKKILVVEDEKDISEIIAYNLTKQGYEVEAAYDGGTGLEKALTGTFDLREICASHKLRSKNAKRFSTIDD